jgi:hypothetical protein
MSASWRLSPHAEATMRAISQSRERLRILLKRLGGEINCSVGKSAQLP